MLPQKNRFAVISMDVEDWYHLDYFKGSACNREVSYMDGLNVFCDLVKSESIKSTFFVVGEVARSVMEPLTDIARYGGEIASHGYGHKRPLEMSLKDFKMDLKRSISTLEDCLQNQVLGYRAPCFSLDRTRLDIVEQLGLRYDSSKISFSAHPLYGAIDLSGYKAIGPYIYQKSNFYEFEVGTFRLATFRVPISGGGYLRMLPWFMVEWMLTKYMRSGLPFILYVHPFELSGLGSPPYPLKTTKLDQVRFSLGRFKMIDRMKRVITMLKENEYKITTFKEMVSNLDFGR